MNSDMNALIVCGQGTYQNGRFFTEFPDRDVYIGHLLFVHQIVEQWKYTHVVCSGSFTQNATSSISEAKSMVAIWEEFQAAPQNAEVIEDELALDSAENVILGLMELRKRFSTESIRRIGVSAAWQFKKPRFNRLAEALGIVDSFYFHGYVGADAADAGDKAVQGEISQLQQMAQSQDYLLLDTLWDNKRRKRYQRDNYNSRLNSLRSTFEKTFSALDALKSDRLNDGYRSKLQAAFAEEVLNVTQ
jgi:hypothetical protein